MEQVCLRLDLFHNLTFPAFQMLFIIREETHILTHPRQPLFNSRDEPLSFLLEGVHEELYIGAMVVLVLADLTVLTDELLAPTAIITDPFLRVNLAGHALVTAYLLVVLAQFDLGEGDYHVPAGDLCSTMRVSAVVTYVVEALDAAAGGQAGPIVIFTVVAVLVFVVLAEMEDLQASLGD